MLGLWGPPGESTHTFAGAEIYKTDGFGQNRDAQRGSAMGQYEGRFGATGSWRLTTQAYATHFHSAGVIREDDYASGKIGFYDSYDLSSFARQQVPEGGDASRYSIAADIETHPGDTVLSQQVFVIKRDMRLLENFTGFLLDVQEPLQSLHDQRGDMLDLNVHELTIGARGSARLAGSFLGQRQELELGYFARGDDAAGKQQRLEASTGVPYRTETDLDAQIGDIGLYGDANLRLRPWLSLRGGARADLLTYDVHNNCAAQSVAHPSTTNPPIDQSCLTQQDLGRPREPDQVTATSGHRHPAARVADRRAAARRFALRELRQGRPLGRSELHHAGRPGAVREHRRVRGRRQLHGAGRRIHFWSRGASSSRPSSTRT